MAEVLALGLQIEVALKIVFYGKLADFFGHELEMEDSQICSIGQLRGKIIASHPNIEAALMNKRVRACVAGNLVDDRYEVSPTDPIEFLAPVSGG